MPEVTVRKADAQDASTIIRLVKALAEFEGLSPPDETAQLRFINDMTAIHPRFEAYLAEIDGVPAGCAVVYETYGSFQAMPKLYLEDIFILKEYRRLGAGKALFQTLVREAKARGCGLMEWTALDWNTAAHEFYRNMGGRRLDTWQTFRMEL